MPYSLESTNADCYEGTSVLINKLNIRNEEQLMETESFVTNLKAIDLMQRTLENDFDFC